MYINHSITTSTVTLTSKRLPREEALIMKELKVTLEEFIIDELQRAVEESALLRDKSAEYMVLVKLEAQRTTTLTQAETFTFDLTEELSSEGILFGNEHARIIHSFRGYCNFPFRSILDKRSKKKRQVKIQPTMGPPFRRFGISAAIWTPLTCVIALFAAGLTLWSSEKGTLTHFRCPQATVEPLHFSCMASSAFAIPNNATHCELLFATPVSPSSFSFIYGFALLTGLLAAFVALVSKLIDEYAKFMAPNPPVSVTQ